MAASRVILIPALAAASALLLRGVSSLTLREANLHGSLAVEAKVSAKADWSIRPSSEIEGTELLNFDNAVLTHSNLGGIGPDSGEKSMIIAPVGKMNGLDLSMKFKVAPNATYSAKPEENTVSGGIASINVLSGELTEIDATIQDSTGKPVILDHFYISVLDIDAGSVIGDGGSPHKEAGIESARFEDINGYYMMANAQIKTEEIGGSLTFIANQTGNAADNPTSSHDLTPDQLIKAVMIEYKATSQFRFEMGVMSQPGGTNGRNFLLAGTSELVDAPFGPCSEAQFLNLAQSTVGVFNLDGQHAGRRQMISYKNAGEYNGTNIDLWVEYVSGTYTPTDPSKNGLFGSLGQINMGINNTATFNFTLVNNVTQDPVAVPNFFFTFFDIDQEEHGAEALTLEEGVGTYFLSTNTSLNTTTNTDGTVTFQSTAYGNQANNPRQAPAANDDQAVTLYFATPVSSFTITYEAISHKHAGRNFQFGGLTDVACPP